MNRRITFAILFAVCLAAALPAQQNQPQFTLTSIAAPVYMLQGNGGNVGIVADPSGLLMIDAMYEASAPQMRAALKTLPSGDRVRVLIDTHWHGDHTDGNKAFGPAASIVAHQNVLPLLSAAQTLLGNQSKPLPQGARPNIVYADKLTVIAGGETIRLVHYPRSHTNGDTVVFFDKSRVVHMGDMFFNGMFPFLDVANGGSIDNWVRQLDVILAGLPPDVKIIPGHGPLAGVAELRSFRQMLFDSADFVRRQMKEGKTIEQVKASALPDRLAPWAKGFLTTPQWFELVYRSLEKG